MTTGLVVIIYGSKNRPTKIENCCVFSVFRGISVLDVERADVSFTLPVFWSCEYSLCDTDKLLLLAAYFAFLKKEKKNHALSWFRSGMSKSFYTVGHIQATLMLNGQDHSKT